MNSVMTAGLHHRWRERAADLARLGPGDRALDVATGTGDLAIELARRVGPGGEVVGSDFSEGMLERARRKAPDAALGVGRRARAALRRTTSSTPRRSASARATSPTSTAGWREMARVVRPGRPRRGARDHDAAASRRCPRSSRSGSTAIVPLLGRLTGDPEAYDLPAELGQALPGPARRSAAAMAAAGLRDVRWILTAGGIIALHSGTVAVSSAEQVLAPSSRRAARTCPG